jgi:hypothetical protein
MLSKRAPFKSNSMKELYKKVIQARYAPLKNNGDFLPDLLTLVKIILNPNPRLRPSCNTLLNQEIIQTYINQHGLVNTQCNFEDQLNFVASHPKQLS